MAGILPTAQPSVGPLAPPRPVAPSPERAVPAGPGFQLQADSLAVTGAPAAGASLSDLVARAKAAQEARTPEKARAEAETVWSDHKEWPSAYRRVEKDFRDVNAPVDATQAQAAHAQLAANQELEAAALQTLDATKRAAYERVRALTSADAPARLALQVLLMEGKLTGGKPSTEGKSLLQELDRMATQPLHPAIDRKALVSDLVQEIAAPSSINQQSRASCIYTSLQIQMVMQQPAEYARLVGGLATPKGQVTLANGSPMTRYRKAESEDGTHRSLATRLWTTGLMAYGASPRVLKDHKFAIDADASAVSYDRVLAGLGLETQRMEGLDPIRMRSRMGEVLDQLKAWTDRGTPVRVSLDWGEGGQEHALHAVTLTGIKDDRAYYMNPWGTEESMRLEELAGRLFGMPHVVEFGSKSP